MTQDGGVLRAGAARVWKYQRVLWWWFFLNFLLAQFAAWSAGSGIGNVIAHSLHSDRLYQGFDVAAFLELTNNPATGMGTHGAAAGLFSLVFFFAIVLLTGGVLEAYRSPGKPSTTQFFSACGQFFWRWIRLLIFSLILLVPVGMLASGVNKWSSTLSSDSPNEKLGFYVLLAGMGLVVFLAMVVRLCFDMAQVRAVALDERAMRPSMVHGFKVTFRNFGSLFWMYFRISFLAWLWLAIAFYTWTRIPGQHVGLTIFLFELTIFWWIATRLWQRASETVWYERYAANLAPLSPSPDDLAGAAATPVYAAPSSPETTPMLSTPPPEAYPSAGPTNVQAEPAPEPRLEDERERPDNRQDS